MKKIVLILFLLSVSLSAQQGEIHYQTFKYSYSNWAPIDDSLTVSFGTSSHGLEAVIKISLVTGKWVTKGSRRIVDRLYCSDFAELNSNLAIRNGLNGLRVSKGFNSVIKDTTLLYSSFNASDSQFLSETNNFTTPLRYSPDGLNWTNSQMDATHYFSFEIVDIRGDRVLAGGNKIAQSFDGGKNFQTIPYNKMPNLTSSYLDYALVGNTGIYVLGNQGAYTNNFGNTWTYSTAPDSVETVRSLKGDSLIGLPVSGGKNLKLSTNFGATWSNWIVSPSDYRIKEIFNNGDTLFLVDDRNTVWRTKDQGVSFDLLLHPSASDLVSRWSEWQNVQAKDSLVVAVGDTGTMIVSTDYGNSFALREKRSEDWKSYSILRNGNILGTTSTGIYLSTDLGVTWTKSVTGYNINHKFSADSTERIIAIGSYVSRDGGLSFSQLSPSNNSPIISVLPSGRMLNFLNYNGNYSVNEYDSLGGFVTLSQSTTINSPYLSDFKMLSDTHGWCVYTRYWDYGSDVYWTNDGWVTRRLMSNITALGNHPSYAVSDVDIYSPTELFYVQSNNSTKLLYNSVDTGKTWLEVDSLPFVDLYYGQEYTSGTARDVDSWWVTNDTYLVRRNPRNWDQWSNFSFGSNLGIASYEKAKKFDVFPNPSSGRVNLPKFMYKKVEVYNMLGMSLGRFEISDGTVNLDKLGSGTYILTYENESSKYISKVQVVN